MFALNTANEVGAEGATKLAEALCSNSSLQTLYLESMQTLAISTPYTVHPHPTTSMLNSKPMI